MIKKLEPKDFPDDYRTYGYPIVAHVAGGTVANFNVLIAKVNELVDAENARRGGEAAEAPERSKFVTSPLSPLPAGDDEPKAVRPAHN